MIDTSEYVAWLLIWLGCLAFILAWQGRTGRGSGLVISYALQLWLIHWLAAAIYALPWYWHAHLALLYGLEESTYAIAGFAVGSTIVVPFFMKDSQRSATEVARDGAPVEARLVRTYLAIGLVVYYGIEPMLHFVPTVGAIAASAANLLLIALCMECWNAFRTPGSNRQAFWRWVGLSACLPFVSIVTKGFLGYGFASMLSVFSFAATIYRPRWKLVVWSVAIGYLGLSLYVTYMRDRAEIRAVVWNDDAYLNRFSTVMRTVSDFELFEPTNEDHLQRIDDRLNQNMLVGLAVANLQVHPDRFANGRTIREAALSIVPRILWPDKPMVAGSGGLVTEFTGLHFDETATSVGIGHVLEWYANFGSAGVLLGMLGMGILVGWVDRKAAAQLYRGDWVGFTLWWLPGLSLLTVGGSLVETVSSAGAGVIVVHLLHRYGPKPLRHRRVAAPSLAFAGQTAAE